MADNNKSFLQQSLFNNKSPQLTIRGDNTDNNQSGINTDQNEGRYPILGS